MSFLPRRWASGSYTGDRLHPIKYSLDLSEQPLSTADMTLPQEDSIELFQFYELATPNESAGIFRVTSITTDYDTGLPKVYFERGETVLGNDLVQKADTSVNGTITQVVMKLLEYQNTPQMWTIGTIEASASIYMDIGEQSILDGLTQMLNYIPEYHLEFDQSQYPWRVHVRANPTTPTSEGRLSRNIVSCSIGYDTSDMCTRVRNDKLSGGYVESSHIRDYDRVYEQTIVIDENASAAQKLAVANSYLANRDKPAITVSISARDLYGVTGVAIDHFQLSQMFRLALPEYSITENLRIIAISYGDVYGRPENVSLTLANRNADLVIDIARSRRSCGGGGGGGGGGGTIAKGVENLKVTLAKTESEVIASVERIDESYAALTVQEGRITAIVTGQTDYSEKEDPDDPDEPETEIAEDIQRYTSSVIQEKDKVSLVVGQTAGGTNYVKAASIVTAINGSDTSVQISADKIYLNGQTIANEIAATYVSTSTLATKIGQIATLQTGNVQCQGNVSATGGVSASGLYIGSGTSYQDVSNGIKLITQNANPPSGQIGITYTQFNGTQQSVNFNIAATQTYIDGVAAAAAGVSITSLGRESGNTFSSNKKTVYFYINATASNGATDRTQVSANVTDSYNAGYDAGKPYSVSHVSHTYYNQTYNITVKITSYNGDTRNMSFTMAI